MRSNAVSGKSSLHPVGGFTLIELMIAMTAGIVVLSMAYQGFIVERKMYAAQAQVTEMLQNARASVYFMERQLRMASSISALDSTNCNSSITYVSVQGPQPRGLSRSTSNNTLQYTQGGQAEPRTGNITCLTIVRAGSLFTITLIARTSAKDPDLGNYRSITISSTVRARCLPVPPSTICS